MLWPDSDKENDVQRAGATRRTVSSPYLWFSQTPKLLIKWGLPFFLRFPCSPPLVALAVAFLAFFRHRTAHHLEILALRHQLGVLQRSVKRSKLTASDRFLLSRRSLTPRSRDRSHAGISHERLARRRYAPCPRFWRLLFDPWSFLDTRRLANPEVSDGDVTLG